MAYKAFTIKKIVADIDQNRIFLPALQRKFVWGKPQIETLFDSLLRNFPIGTFLFWSIAAQKADEFVFYEFLKEYDERAPFNRRKTGAFTHDQIIGVLDGQQRLSAIYLGLMGTHTEKTPYKRWSNPDAFEKTALYLNLLSLPLHLSVDGRTVIESEDRDYEFRFLTEDEAAANSRPIKSDTGAVLSHEPMLWMKVGDALKWDKDLDTDGLADALDEQCSSDEQKGALVKDRRIIKRTLGLLHLRLCEHELINYFEVAKDDLEDILKIFVRVNSGGTLLSKTDLLFSTIVATWDDGREKIEDLLKAINTKGDGFSFGNEFLMRCCLVLTDGPVVYRVNSFKAENVQRIREEWPSIAKAVSAMVDLLAEFGFSGDVLTSQNATIIIAYYLYKGGATDKTSKDALRRYLVQALLKRIFSGSQDQVITAFRHALRIEDATDATRRRFFKRFSSLSFEDILSIELPQQKSLSVTRDDIDRFLDYRKGADAFHVLTLLYPHLRFSDAVFHQDHIHPFSRFSATEFTALELPREKLDEWTVLRDSLPNLQLLNGRRNSSKNDSRLIDWMASMSPEDRKRFDFENFLPPEIGYDFAQFPQFIAARRALLTEKLCEVLNVAPAPIVVTPMDDVAGSLKSEPAIQA